MEVPQILDLVIAGAWLAAGIMLLRIDLTTSRGARWLTLVVAFCVVRSADLVVSATMNALSALEVLLQTVGLGLLLALAFGARRLGLAIGSVQDEAQTALQQYGRALLDYTQLVRHRIANPLTAIKGGLQTLLELELELPTDTRRELMKVMLQQAEELERTSLHPERVSEEEATLAPTPAPLEDRQRRRSLEATAANVEANFRQLNRHLVDAAPDHLRELEFLCECSAADCATPLRMSLADYIRIHADPDQFVVAPNHDLPSIEEVVHQEADWWIIRKTDPTARAVVETRD